MPVIYVDVLVAVNAVTDCFLIKFTAALMKVRISPLRLLAGAMLGGASSLLMLVPGRGVLTAAANVAAMSLMVLVCFGKTTFRGFLRSAAVFFAVNLLFAGLMLLMIVAFFEDKAIYRSGAVYFDVDIMTVVMFTVICYAVLSAVSFIARKRTVKGSVFELRLRHGGRTVRCKAFYDTGNLLRESFSGVPVIIISGHLARELLSLDTEALENAAALGGIPGFRLIPCSTVGGPGLLPAFRPDSAEVFAAGGWHRVDGAFAAVKKGGFSGGEFEAILGTPVFDEINNEVKSYEKTENENVPSAFADKTKARR